MENCTLYSHYLKFDQLAKIIKDHIPKAKVEQDSGSQQKRITVSIKNGFFGKAKTLTINYRERENPSYNLEEVSCALSNNLNGMVNFVHSIPMSNTELKSKFMHKIMAVNAELAFIAEPNMNEQFRSILKRIAVELDAFIFTAPISIFTASQQQHFVDKHFKLILDTAGNSQINSLDVNIESKYFDGDQENITEGQQTRKAKSEAFLNTKGIKVNTNLPYLEDEAQVTIRTKSELIHRIYALLLISARGEGVEKEKLDALMNSKHIVSLSAKEKAIYHKEELDDQDRANATWRYESLSTLLWAAGKVEWTYPSDICDVPTIVGMLVKTDKDEFVESWKIRSKSEILDALDKIYRMNWACVDARIKGQAPKGGINASVVYERHYALNWLTNYQDQDWDDVSTDT